MLMFYRRRASPKHRYGIIEVDYGGEGHRTWLKDPRVQLLCLWGAPDHIYKGVEEGGGPAPMACPGGVLLPPGVGFPPLIGGHAACLYLSPKAQ